MFRTQRLKQIVGKEAPGVTYERVRMFQGVRIHRRDQCSKNFGKHCPFDNPSDHTMKSWPMLVRTDTYAFGLIERTCTHGVGHPDPDSVEYMNEATSQRSWGVHGCDGCCA